MATLALGVAGAAIGAQVIPAVSLLGTTITGAAIGQAVGAFAGGLIDQALFGASGQSGVVEGPRLSELRVLGSTEGAAIARVYGTTRLSGQVIWARPIEERAVTSGLGGGGKGVGGSGGGTRTDYTYHASFAVGLCEGEITRIGRVWADGEPLDLSLHLTRLHRGTQDQLPDSLIEAVEGAGSVPGFRGLAYIVFEDLDLTPFGNRIPQLSFEVVRVVDDFNRSIAAINIIPASGEFAYDTTEVTRSAGPGVTVAENVHAFSGGTDWSVSIDQLQAELPSVRNSALVVAWFGDDLRAGDCRIRPAVEGATKVTLPYPWRVAGLDRADAHVVSTIEGRPAYGGTPSDRSVLAAIADLKSRGLAVTFNPFVLMDVPPANALPDPYGATLQGAYPWRGRITVTPAAGLPGTADRTTAAASQIAAFVGLAAPTDFSIVSGEIVYSGPAEWSLRRFVLHYAHLCALAGGVDAFLIGSELRGLTSVRDGTGGYPFVDALVALAADVRAILGPSARITYGADWSEFFGHQPADGSGDVHFHLDKLWASPAIDAVGIDAYWPLSDWRSGISHLDAATAPAGIYDLAYLRSNIRGGEYFDWYYPSETDRRAQNRVAITDGLGKPWVFRPKDIWSWWSNQHFDRPGGVESATPTGWVPRSKPIWLTEAGCPAVDLGANQPNVFYDPKSAESALPHFSLGKRDDLMQRRYLEALIGFFDSTRPDFSEDDNPQSPHYPGRMLDIERVYVYAWDARPYPAFPLAIEVWGDGHNWARGHWLNGRTSGSSLAAVVRAILDDHGHSVGDASQLHGFVEGYLIDRLGSARQALQPLELAYFFDSIEIGADIAFRPRNRSALAATFDRDGLVETAPGAPLVTVRRAEEAELPSSARIAYVNPALDYRQSAVESRRLAGHTERVAVAEVPLALGDGAAQAIADLWLHETWTAREEARATLPPSALAIEPGDHIVLSSAQTTSRLRVVSVGLGDSLAIEARPVDPTIYGVLGETETQASIALPAVHGASDLLFLDLPFAEGGGGQIGSFVMCDQTPWPGAVSVLREAPGGVVAAPVTVRRRAVLGTLATPLTAGPLARWDNAGTCEIELARGALTSLPDALVLAGGNLLAVEQDTGWELLQFARAEPVAASRYRITRLLRGRFGSDVEMAPSVPPGRRCALIDGAETPLPLSLDDVGLATEWRFGPPSRDIAHASWTARSHAFSGAALRPLAPVHLRARVSAGDVIFAWTRRTRIGGDGWHLAEVPLGEVDESYLIEVLDGLSVRRSWTTVDPEVVYTAAQQIADFGSPQSTYRVRVRQLSALVGPGAAREALLAVL